MAIALSITLSNPSLSLPYESAPYLHDFEDGAFPSIIDTYNITASVVMKLSKAVKVSELSIRFVSQQFLQDHEEERTGSCELFSQNSRPIARDGTVMSGGAVLAAGVHQFDAKFVLPSWLPASLSTASSRMVHRVVARLECAGATYVPFNLSRNVKTAIQELVIVREPPTALNALRYWSGQRRSAATSLAIKTTRFARIDGKLRLSMRVKSFEQVQSCSVDIVQEETCWSETPADSFWHDLPGTRTAHADQPMLMPFLSSHDLESGNSKRCKFPMPTISTAFPEPDNAEETSADMATLSTLSLQFPLSGPELQARYESPLVSIKHILRIRIRFMSAGVKEIVVNIPVCLFAGPASCDDIPPYYDDIYSEQLGYRSRSDSVATLPLYALKDTVILNHPAVSPRVDCTSQSSDVQEQRRVENWLENDLNMTSPAVALTA